MAFSWTTTTTPFTDPLGTEPARFVLQQVDDTWFHLVEPFRYQRRDGDEVHVHHEALGPTDLASIQPAVAWFVTRHGRHTPAALVHDQLTTRAGAHEDRVEADRTFRDAMEDLGVPPVRAWVMWAAVAGATRWTGGPLRRAGMATWIAAALAGTGLFVHGVVRRRPGQVALALVAPVPAAGLWGRQWRAGLIAGYAVWVLLIPTGTSFGGYGVYWGLERGLKAARQLLARRGAPEPPGPVPFAETT